MEWAGCEELLVLSTQRNPKAKRCEALAANSPILALQTLCLPDSRLSGDQEPRCCPVNPWPFTFGHSSTSKLFLRGIFARDASSTSCICFFLKKLRHLTTDISQQTWFCRRQITAPMHFLKRNTWECCRHQLIWRTYPRCTVAQYHALILL